MPREPLDSAIVQEIQQQAYKGLGIDRLHKHLNGLSWVLEKNGGMPVSRGSVQRYLAEWKERREELERFVEPIQWESLPAYGLPQEAAAALLPLWGQELARHKVPSVDLPSVVQASWWWRIHQSALDAPQAFVRWAGMAMAEREYFAAIEYPGAVAIAEGKDIWLAIGCKAWEKEGFIRYKELAGRDKALEASTAITFLEHLLMTKED